jgi:uncharacterized membrane protein YphA (DoxX/SURF4 family)
MNILSRALIFVVTLATGSLFIYSAYTKLFPIEPFEHIIASSVHLPLMAASVAARFFISLEAALGMLLVLHLWGKGRWVVRSAIGLVVFFSIYLALLWAIKGDDVNCGCFGDAIWMTPSSSLLKNAALLAALWAMNRWGRPLSYQWTMAIPWLVCLCAAVTIYFIAPVFRPYRLDLAPVYADKDNAPVINLSKGKHVIAFVHPFCMHCRKTALRLHEMRQADSTLPLFMVIGGTGQDITDFWKASHAQDVPHTRIARAPFIAYTHDVFPLILWVNNGTAEAEIDYPELDAKRIRKWANDTLTANGK